MLFSFRERRDSRGAEPDSAQPNLIREFPWQAVGASKLANLVR
jgi:hypothetical protein